MTAEFMAEYIKATREANRLWRRRLLYTMNPNKLRATAFLIDYHEVENGTHSRRRGQLQHALTP